MAIGLALALRLSVRLGLCPPADSARLERHLRAVGLMTMPSGRGHAVPVPALLTHMRRDKKMRDGCLAFVLVRGIGHAFTSRDVVAEDVQAVLEGCRDMMADLQPNLSDS